MIPSRNIVAKSSSRIRTSSPTALREKSSFATSRDPTNAAKDRPYSSRAHLKLRLRNVDLAAVDELDDELEVVEADVLGHDDRRVFARIRQQELLEIGAASRQHHLNIWKRTRSFVSKCRHVDARD